MKTAINVKTKEWRSIVHHLYSNGWIVKEKYIGHDASIDIDYLILANGQKTAEFGWDNWDEGEIKCDEKVFEFLESILKLKFEFGEPKFLSIKNLAFIKLLSFPTRMISNKTKLMEDFFYFK